MRLGDILVRRGRATPEQVGAAAARAADETGLRLGEALVAAGAVAERDVVEALAEQSGLPFVARIAETSLDPALVERVPVEWVRGRLLLPARHEGRPAVFAADPAAPGIEELQLLLGVELPPVLAPAEEIRQAIERCYLRREGRASEFIRGLEAPPPGAAAAAPAEDLLRTAEGAPVTQLVNLILLEAVKADASDIHLEPFEDRLRVRYRIDGFLYDRASPPKHLEAAVLSRLKVMARLDIAEKRLPQDGVARLRVGPREIDVRVSTVPVAGGERIVLRLLNKDSTVLALHQLGMPGAMVDRFRDLVAAPQGIVLVTGPTGSGKTTTLYAALQELDTRRLNVMTIEDPVEYQLPSISQIQVNPRIDLTFARALRHVLRQDPDVILVGETRDLETAEIAIRASLTGHLVFTTLHTNDAVSAPVRLADMGVPPYLLSAALRGVLAQRLVRRLCPACRREAAIGPDDVDGLGDAARAFVGRPHWRPVGCDRCLDGYRGRTGLFELMRAEGAVAEAVRTGAGPVELRRVAAAAGMAPLLADGLAKAAAGETSLDELRRAVGEADGAAAAQHPA
jgi:general secretion pathway protein E